MTIDIEGQVLSEYLGFSKDSRVNKYKERFSPDELKTVVNHGIYHMTTIITSLKCKDAASMLLGAGVIEKKLGNASLIERDIPSLKSMADMSYNSLFAFLRGDQEGVSYVMKWDKPIPEDKLSDVSGLTKVTIGYCLDRFREDIKKYQSKKRISWADSITPSAEHNVQAAHQ